MKVSLRVLVLFCLLAFVLGIGGGYVVFTVTGGDSAAPSANPALAHDDRRAPDNEEETGKRNGRDAQQPGGNPSGNEVSDHTPEGDNLTKPAPAPTDTPGTEPGNAASNPATPKDSEPADAEREEPETPFGRTVDFEVTISGTVVDAHGRPVANAAIDSSITERAERSVRIKSGPVFARTDSDGTFTGTLKSKAGDKGTTSVILVASATGHADSNPLTLEIANGTAKTGVRIALRAAGSVMGRAVDRNGIGVPGVTVTLAPRAGDSGIQVGGPGTVSSGSSAPKGVSDANGDFVVQDLPAGSFNLLGRVRILIVNDEEVRQLAGEANLLKAARWVQDRGPEIVVVKKGEHGAILFAKDWLFYVPGFPLEEVFDPTGAGDAFAGGFVGYLASCESLTPTDLRRAMVYGSVMGSFTVERFSVNRLVDIPFADIESRMERFREITAFEAGVNAGQNA
jgi:hypothetical protein